jgi:hypothetical protein
MLVFSQNDYLYDWVSCIYDHKIYFGPFPNQVMAERLIDEGFNVILNLTMPDEEPPYFLPYFVRYYFFPIQDNSFPVCGLSYCSMISRIKKEFASGKKIYIHCRGGHGRSSMTCVSLVASLFSYDLRRAIEYVNESHNQREVLRNKWRKRKSPFNYDQFIFLTKMHKNIYLNLCRPNKYYQWLLSDEKVQYVTVWAATNLYYPNILELCRDPDIFYDDKFCSLFSFLYKKFSVKDDKFKLHLTYLKRFVVTDSDCPLFTELFDDAVRMVRDFLEIGDI